MMKISAEVQKLLLGKIPGVQREMGKTYLQFDRITIDSVSGKADFFWDGKLIFTIQPEGYSYGCVLTLNGIEGRMEGHLSA